MLPSHVAPPGPTHFAYCSGFTDFNDCINIDPVVGHLLICPALYPHTSPQHPALNELVHLLHVNGIKALSVSHYKDVYSTYISIFLLSFRAT